MSGASPPHIIDVVVLSWNDGDLLARAVESVLPEQGCCTRVTVIDNGSDEPPMIPEHPDVRLIRNEENRGVAPARNQGARSGDAPLICFLDSDAVLLPGSLLRLADVVAGDPAVAVAGPVFVDQDPEASGGAAPTPWRKLGRVFGLVDRYARTERAAGFTTWDVDFVIGACQMVRREAFESIGGLDESYFYGPEDVDFCLRLREQGWRIVQVADAPVQHPPRRRNRRLLSRRGVQHAWAVCRHLWRHRRFQQRVRMGESRNPG